MSNKGLVFLDFAGKKVYFANEKRKVGNSVPATVKERNAFITHFYNKGKIECTFRELKEHVDFHGTRVKGRIYATVHITEPFVYMKLLEKDEDMQSAIEKYVWAAVQKHRDTDMKRIVKTANKKFFRMYLKYVDEHLDELFDLQ